jgi:hypothetical protein
MWTRFATVVLLSCAGCATVYDDPARKPTNAATAENEREMLSHMHAPAPAPAPSPPLAPMVWSEPARGGR